MTTLRDKYFKNKLDPKDAYYQYIRIYEINKLTEQGLENCISLTKYHYLLLKAIDI